jgi:parallel beta-helix repeat protein
MFSEDRKTLLPALLLLTILAVIVALATSTAGSTDVDSDVTTDTTWNTAGSPYKVRANIVVRDGVTLTINQGVVVEFTGLYYLDCSSTGRIVATGSEDEPINFTSSSSTPAAGDWQYVATGSGGTLDHCNFLHASMAVKVHSGGTLSNADIRASTTGVFIESAGGTVEGVYIFGLQVGIAMNGATNAVIRESVVESCVEGINFLGTTENSRVVRSEALGCTAHGIGIVATGAGNKVEECYIARCPTGILVRGLRAPTAQGDLHLFNNTIEAFADIGIHLDNVGPVSPILVQRNKIHNGNNGICATTSDYFELTENTFRENSKGAKVDRCTGYTATIHKNNFIQNSLHEAISTSSEVLWDKNGKGNFWWVAVYSYGFQDNNGDGIADREWTLTGTQKDNYPLMKPVDFENPIAEAGDDISARQHISFDLDGSGSRDDTWVANYTWTVDLPGEDVVAYGMEVEDLVIHEAGEFIVTLVVRDAMGNTGTDTLNLTVDDRDRPEMTARNTPGKAGAGTYLVFSFNITDNIGVTEAWVTYRIGLSGKNNRVDLDHKGDDVWQNRTFLPVTTNQKVYYVLTARDAANNILRTQEREISVTDITPPTIESALPGNLTTGDLNWVNMTVTDNRQMDWVTLEYWYGEDGEHFTVNLTMMGLLWVTELDVPRDAPSPAYLVFNATDLAGNWNLTDPIEINVLDDDSPVLNIDNTSSRLHKGEEASIRAIISDNIAIESAFVEVRYPPDTQYTATPLTYDGTEWVAEILVKSTGVRIHYHFKVTDTSGNVLVTEDTERLMLSQRPEIVTVPELEAWEGQEYSQDFEAEDPDNEDYEFQWKMETNATWLLIDAVEGVVSGTPDDVHVGWYWVNITVLDPDGVDDWYYYELVVHDVNAKPEVSIVSPPDEQKVGTILRVSGRATDDLGEIEWVKVKVDEGEWVDAVGTKTWTYEVSVKDLKPGTHFLYAKSYDGVSESKVTELAFIVPKKDEPDDSPGFGSIVAVLAIAAGLVLAVAVTRGRR